MASNYYDDEEEWQRLLSDLVDTDGALDEITNTIHDPAGLDFGLSDTLHAAQQQRLLCENATPNQGRINDASKADAASTLVDLGSAEYVHATQQQFQWWEDTASNRGGISDLDGANQLFSWCEPDATVQKLQVMYVSLPQTMNEAKSLAELRRIQGDLHRPTLFSNN
jgi:hypothetical protein